MYYGRPPAVGTLERRLGLTRLFGEDFVWELWYARIMGCQLVFIPTGCMDNDLKSTWMEWDGGNVCGNCGFFNRCDDEANRLNFRRVRRYFAFAIGNDSEAKVSREFNERRIKYKAIDLDAWNPALDIPERFKLPPTSKLRVLHSNFLKKSGRAWQGRNIKGSPFVVAAVERLAAEGYPVELLSIEDVPSRNMRFYQAQADIVVEQLIYGWWGSTGVETMALGKPVVCYIRASWKAFFLAQFPEYTELPIVEADVNTVYDVLKRLVEDAEYRAERGQASRRFAEAHFNPAANARALAELLQTA
jgi:glycosyltransferase involved in cell wall biosynthesis